MPPPFPKLSRHGRGHRPSHPWNQSRAAHPVSKQAIWRWLARTILCRLWPQAQSSQLTSQRFWDHMDRIEGSTGQEIWQAILGGVLQREKIDLSQICYDGTNFYTFID